MIEWKSRRTISMLRLIAVLTVSVAAAALSAACNDQDKGGGSGQASSAQPSASSDVNPIHGTVSVTPSTGLKSSGDNAVAVTVSVSGFAANMELFAGQCAHIDGLFICESSRRPPTKLMTDKDGNGTAQVNVRRTFEGFVVAGERWGEVDCAVQTCYVGVGNHIQGAASDRLAFEPS
jgi:hypothetical protein